MSSRHRYHEGIGLTCSTLGSLARDPTNLAVTQSRPKATYIPTRTARWPSPKLSVSIHHDACGILTFSIELLLSIYDTVDSMDDDLAKDFLDLITTSLRFEASSSMGSVFVPAPLTFDAAIVGDDTKVRATLCEYLLTQTEAFYLNSGEARADLEIYKELYLDRISSCALQTLYVCLTHSVDVTLDYLFAIELLSDSSPMLPGDKRDVTYYKETGVDGKELLRTVAESTTRRDVKVWANQAATRAVRGEVVGYLDQIWGEEEPPFTPFLSSSRPYQIGRKRGVLSFRIRLENIAIAQADPGRLSRWHSCVSASTTQTRYYVLFNHTAPDMQRRVLEHVSSP